MCFPDNFIRHRLGEKLTYIWSSLPFHASDVRYESYDPSFLDCANICLQSSRDIDSFHSLKLILHNHWWCKRIVIFNLVV